MTSQGLYYDSIVNGPLPPHGPFQLLVLHETAVSFLKRDSGVVRARGRSPSLSPRKNGHGSSLRRSLFQECSPSALANATFRSRPTLNLTVLWAGTAMRSSVLGFCAMRAAKHVRVAAGQDQRTARRHAQDQVAVPHGRALIKTGAFTGTGWLER